jgi:hypothetical protein
MADPDQLAAQLAAANQENQDLQQQINNLNEQLQAAQASGGPVQEQAGPAPAPAGPAPAPALGQQQAAPEADDNAEANAAMQLINTTAELVRSQRLTSLTTLKVFKGVSTDDPSEYINNYEDLSDMLNLTDQERIAGFAVNLQAAAGRWLRGLGAEHKNTWQNLKAAFSERFLRQKQADVIKVIRHRKQGANETVESYANAITALMSRVEPYPEVQKAIDFTQNLLPSLRRHVMLQDCSTLDQSIKSARAAEREFEANTPQPRSRTLKFGTELDSGEHSFNMSRENINKNVNQRGGRRNNVGRGQFITPSMPGGHPRQPPMQQTFSRGNGRPLRGGYDQRSRSGGTYRSPYPGSRENGTCFGCGENHFIAHCPHSPGALNDQRGRLPVTGQ